jgi:diaminopimelate decarboxylase
MKAPRQRPSLEHPSGFTYRKLNRKNSSGNDSVLHADELPLSHLAKRFGTPLYVYSSTTIRDRYETLNRAFGSAPHTVCYSVKANSNLSILRLLSRLGSGFDIVSGGELERVLAADRKAAGRIVFSGVGKTVEELTAGLRAGILLFNVEGESELAALDQCAGRLRKKASFALRVNPDVAAQTHPYISTGLHQHKFGVPFGDAKSLYAKALRSKYLAPCGVSVHIGSQISAVAPFGEALTRVAELVRELRASGHQIDYVDAGGGLGIPYDKRTSYDFAASVAAYAGALTTALEELDVHLLLEPGRSIVGPAGLLLTSVIYKKKNDSKQFLVVDAAMNDLIRPALYHAYHEIVPVKQNQKSRKPELFDIVGPICETGDFFARDREFPSVDEGDLLAILDAGAYGMALSSNYNTRTRPAEVVVTGKTAKLIRRRERVADLLRLEQL